MEWDSHGKHQGTHSFGGCGQVLRGFAQRVEEGTWLGNSRTFTAARGPWFPQSRTPEFLLPCFLLTLLWAEMPHPSLPLVQAPGQAGR